MNTASNRFPVIAVLLALPLLLVACDVTIREGTEGGGDQVNIQTPFGGVSVNTEVDPADTGLPVYPGARIVRDGGEEPGSANVNVGIAGAGVRVVAAKFESDDAPDAIVDFYRGEMATYGEVMECRGNIDFKGRSEAPVCDERPSSREIQLVVGTAERHRIVDVEPQGDGSEFAVVYIQTRGRS